MAESRRGRCSRRRSPVAEQPRGVLGAYQANGQLFITIGEKPRVERQVAWRTRDQVDRAARARALDLEWVLAGHADLLGAPEHLRLDRPRHELDLHLLRRGVGLGRFGLERSLLGLLGLFGGPG